MGNRDFYRYFGRLHDEELRRLFNETLEQPSSLDGPYMQTWRVWLVDYLLSYFHSQPLSGVIDQCRYTAFALRYLAALEIDSQSPLRVQQVLFVMENRPDVIASLLFGSLAERHATLRTAFEQIGSWERPQLERYQEVVLQSYLRRFEERKNGIGAPTFDESTVAKWSRDLLPVLENHVLEQFKPARRVAEGKVIQRVVSREVLADPTMSERSILAEYVDLCEHGPLSIYHGIALAALNDYDQRIGNERRFFQSQRRTALIACALFLVMVVLLIGSNTAMMPLRGELLRFAGFISGICGVVLFVLMLAKVWVSTTMAAEHITKTRTDIQTLRQLADEVNEGSSS